MKRYELSEALAAAPAVEDRRGRGRPRCRHEFAEYGHGKSCRIERGWHPSRNLQSHIKENSGYEAFTTNRSPG